MITTALTRRLGLRHPIVCAPMGGVAGGRLAAAVSAAGGLGMLGVGSRTPADWIAREAATARGGGPFGIGLLVWRLLDEPELLDAAVAERPDAIALSFGDPAPWAGTAKAAGAVVMAQAQDVSSVQRALDAGADVIVAQGTEAGGHTGHVATLPLLQAAAPLAELAGTPLVGAGGIGTGAGIAAVLAAGAAGAWVGTRFAATAEALGSPRAKARILAAESGETVHTRAYDLAAGLGWPAEYPGRALRSEFTDRWHGREAELAKDPAAAAAELAPAKGGPDPRPVYAGMAAGLVDDLPAAGNLVARLAADAETALRRAAAQLR